MCESDTGTLAKDLTTFDLSPRCLATLVVLSTAFCLFTMPSACLSSFKVMITSCHLTVANRKFTHRLIGNTPIVNRPYTAIKGGVEASCGAGHRGCIGGWGILEIGCHTLLRYSYFPPDIVPICKLDPSLLGSYRGESVILTPQ